MDISQNSDISVYNDHFEPNMNDRSDVKCLEQIRFCALPSGANNQDSNLKQAAKDFDVDHCERKKKTRRGKPKRKKPYNKEVSVVRIKNFPKSRSNNCSRFRSRHPVAPNNTNQFLMEDHKDLQLQELDERLQATANKANEGTQISNFINPSRPARVRDSSFTSAESDEEFFYSSPEDEEEFLTKEFSNTYTDLHAESLQKFSKPELIQQVITLEASVDKLEKERQNYLSIKSIITDCDNESKLIDKTKTVADYEKELEKLKLLNEQLMAENERLKNQHRSSSVSSVDSESDSSSSSESSASSGSASDNENKYDEVENIDDISESNLNGVMVPQGVCSMESEDVT